MKAYLMILVMLTVFMIGVCSYLNGSDIERCIASGKSRGECLSIINP